MLSLFCFVFHDDDFFFSLRSWCCFTVNQADFINRGDYTRESALCGQLRNTVKSRERTALPFVYSRDSSLRKLPAVCKWTSAI